MMSQHTSSANRRLRKRPAAVRLILGLLIIALASSAGIGALMWWEERPVAHAEALLDAGEPRQAMIVIESFLRDHPDHGRALSLKARLLVANGQPAPAIDLFERVGAAGPEEMHAWAQALLMEQRWSAARPILEYILESGVDRADVLHELAACRLKLGDLEGSLAAAEDFSREPGFAARGHLLVGTIHRERGSFRRAADAWAEVVKHDENAQDLQVAAGEFFLEYGRVRMALGESEAAAELFERSLAEAERPDALVALGDAQAQCGRPGAADAAYRRALDLDPTECDARIGLAELALTGNDPAAARNWLEPLEFIEPSTVELAYLFQRTYARLGDEEAADRWRREADELRKLKQLHHTVDQLLRHNPDSMWAYVVRAWRFAENGNWAEAERSLAPVDSLVDDSPFIADLCQAVKTRGPLPPLEQLPMSRH